MNLNEQHTVEDFEKASSQLVTGLYTKINMLEDELRDGRRLSRALLDKLNKVWSNGQYRLAFQLYAEHFGDYIENGGVAVGDEQTDLDEWVNKK